MSASGPAGERGATEAQRRSIGPLLVPTHPADAMTAYYALEYDPERVRLHVHRAPQGQVDGFVAVCQTRADLFVPLVVMRAPEGLAASLLRQALHPGRPYTVVTTPLLRRGVEETLLLERQQLNCVYAFDPPSFHPVINVMVQPGPGPFRFEIRVGDRVMSAAGINWRSAHLAEMYVYTEPEAQGRGWGRAVGAMCVRSLLDAGLLPLYAADGENAASQALARALGFVDKGIRELESLGQLRG
ncbi:MAG: GNAT family N-acetyltransferase [Anaerolineae bacterium]|nr:GNAT family N-acetyltransferase [Anaerolineae bacterium]